jgi:hypothetical protein
MLFSGQTYPVYIASKEDANREIAEYNAKAEQE